MIIRWISVYLGAFERTRHELSNKRGFREIRGVVVIFMDHKEASKPRWSQNIGQIGINPTKTGVF